MRRLKEALQDIKRGIGQHRVWTHLGWVEVKQRYRRSIIGPWWISLSMLIFILMMGIVFSRLFHQKLEEYIPFFTAGFLFWTFISNSVVEAADVFRGNGGYIMQTNLPFSLYVFKHLIRQGIFLLHNFMIYLLVCIYFQLNPGVVALLAIPGFLLLAINMYWICFLVGMICVRYRDMVPMISSCVQIAFFVTPISWMPRLLDQNPGILKYNPLVYLLEIVRSPLLGHFPSTLCWIVNLNMALAGCLISLFIFSFARSRIAFWVD